MDNIWWSTGYASSDAWMKADENRKYLRDSRRITPTIINKENMQLDKILPGDIAYFFNNEDLTEVTADDIIYAQHSEPKNDGAMKQYLSDNKYAKVEFYRPR